MRGGGTLKEVLEHQPETVNIKPQIPGVLYICGQARPDIRGAGAADVAIRTWQRLEKLESIVEGKTVNLPTQSDGQGIHILGEKRSDINSADKTAAAMKTVEIYTANRNGK